MGFDPDVFENDLSDATRPGKIDEILDGLDEADAKVLEGALRDLSIPANRIKVALCNQGYQLTAVPVQTWRAKHVAS